MKNNRLLFLLFLGIIIFPAQAFAVCPVCALAVGAGLELSHYLGIDDSVTSLWIGALIVSFIMWTLNWLDQKNYHFAYKKTLVALSFYVLTLLPLYWQDILGNPFNTLWGLDKIGLGIAIGGLTFYLSEKWYDRLKEKNHQHAYFPFQKVVMPVTALLILSVIFYFITQ